jgi:hypothetical protein
MESIHLFKNNNHRVGQWQSKMFRIGQPRGKRNAMASLPPTAVFYSWSAKSVKEKSILQLSCIKGKDAICGQARSIQGMESTYSVHQGNVPQGQRGTQVDGHWHCYKCSTECSTEQGKAHSPAQRTIQAHDSNKRLHCRHRSHEHCSHEHQGNTLVPR